MKMRSLVRWIVVLGLLGGGLYYAADAYLGSGGLRARVAARLRETLGVPVTVGGVDVGLHAGAATDLVIFEADASTGASPCLTVSRAEVDIGLADWLSGRRPEHIKLDGAVLTFRFTREGQLLTKLPTPQGAGDAALPKVELKNGRLRLEREGWPDFAVNGVDATITGDGRAISLAGKVNDPAWGGEWAALGRALPGGASTLDLRSARSVHVTPEILSRVPFVKPSVWTHFAAEGDTPVHLTLQLPRREDKVRYRVDLSPTNTRVHIPSIDLSAEKASGRVVVDDNLVQLADVRGVVAKGELHVRRADLDFRQPTSPMRFDLDAKRLNVQLLPPSWKIPAYFGGWLSGLARIQVQTIRGVTLPSGAGEVSVEAARLVIVPVGPLKLKFQLDGDGIHFDAQR